MSNHPGSNSQTKTENAGVSRTAFSSMTSLSALSRLSTSIRQTLGGSWSTFTDRWSRFYILSIDQYVCWRSFTGSIRRLLGLKSSASPTRPYEFLRRTRSQSTSSIPSVPVKALETNFSYQDIMAAKVLVKRLVGSEMRPGPKDLLLLPNAVAEQWYTDEAVRYLQEQKEKRSQPVAVIN